MFILTVGWSKRMNSLSKMALVLYCIVLTIIPLAKLHVEDLLPDRALLTSQSHQETDLVVLIHQVFFAHLCNISDHFMRSVKRIFYCLIDHTGERLFPEGIALKLCLLSLALLAYVSYAARRYSSKRGNAFPQTIFCYRLFEHSPPSLYFQ